jgi:hypothetical protein
LIWITARPPPGLGVLIDHPMSGLQMGPSPSSASGVAPPPSVRVGWSLAEANAAGASATANARTTKVTDTARSHVHLG